MSNVVFKKYDLKSFSSNTDKPYEHLLPIIETLAKNGNRPCSNNPFNLEKDGWICQMEKPLNFQLIKNSFNIPGTIKLSYEHNSILDQNSWIEIKGGV